jgi:pimeloyl-ACP methyl ester carboxylesterase
MSRLFARSSAARRTVGGVNRPPPFRPAHRPSGRRLSHPRFPQVPSITGFPYDPQALAFALALGLTGSTTAYAETKPTVVLVHGAFADSSSWNGVVADLSRDGYRVVAAANPLRGLASDAASVRTVSIRSPGRSSWSDTPTAVR